MKTPIWLRREAAIAGSLALIGILNAGSRAEAQIAATGPRKAVARHDMARAHGIEEVVVTAQKRKERLQDVPISVSVITSNTVRNFGVVTTLDLQKAVPGFIAQQRNLNATPFLRGIGNDVSTPGDESPIAVYVDGVYRSTSTATTFALANIGQIEILKGPQGTLFGRNAAGGVISITSKQPSQTFSGSESVGYANYNTVTDDAYVTGGITPNLAANLSLHYSNQLDGWGKNVATGNDTYRTISKAVASTWRLSQGDTAYTFNVDYSKDRFDGGPGSPEGLLPGQGSQLNGKVYYAGLYNINSDTDPYLTLENYGASLRVEHTFSFAQLVNISAFRGTRGSLFADSDATPISPFDVPSGTSKANIDTFSTATLTNQGTEEVQLQSLPGSTIKWIGGVFLLYSRTKAYTTLYLPGVILNGDDRLPTKSVAGFGQATAPILPRIIPETDLTLGFRYTVDDKGHSGQAYGSPVVVTQPTETYRSPTWRVALDHKFAPDFLGYASYNRGFKSGVYGTGAFYSAVAPETINAFEVGIKTEWFQHRLVFNAAAYHTRIDDLQISSTVLEPNGGSYVALLNAAKVRINGIDAELIAQPTRNLRLSTSASFLDGKYLDFKDAPLYVYAPDNRGEIRTIGDATGRQTDGTPPFSLSASASYLFETRYGEFQLAVNDNYIASYYLTPDHLNKIDNVNLVGLSGNWTSPSGIYFLRAWANNLFDRRYYQLLLPRAVQTIGSPGAPQTFGVNMTFKF